MLIPHRPDLSGYVRIEMVSQVDDGWLLFVEQEVGTFAKVELAAQQAAACETLSEEGAGGSLSWAQLQVKAVVDASVADAIAQTVRDSGTNPSIRPV